MTSPVSGGAGGPLGAAFVDGLNAKQMLVFESLADDYMIEILTQVADAYADKMEAAAGVLVADSLVPSADDAAHAAGAVDPAIFAGVPAAVSESLAVSMIPLVAEVYQSSQGRVRAGLIDELGVTLPPIHSLDAAAYLRRAPKVFEDVGDQLQSAIRAGLAEGFEAGESIPQLAARVRAAAGVTARKATLIARTSVIDASNVGSLDMAKVSGLDMQKEWLATVPTDGRTRPTHIAADGQRVDLHGKFTVGGFECDHPGEYTLPDAEKLGCRCTQGYVVPRAQVMETDIGREQAQARMRELREQRGPGGRTRTTVTGVDPDRVLPPTALPPASRRLNQDQWGTAADPAMKMTVTQLREILTREGITHIRKADRKEFIVRSLRDWEIMHGRTALPAMPDLNVPAVTTTTRLGQFTARWDRPDASQTLVGQDLGSRWDRALTVDTGPGGVEVRNLRTQGGYLVKYGRAWRIDGTPYLIETSGPPLSLVQQAHVLRTLGELRQLHADIPSADQFNRAYAYYLGRNPKDSYWAATYKTPGFRSYATAGDGTVSIWDNGGVSNSYPSPKAASIKHETGHNVDALYADQQHPNVGANGQAWTNAARSDAAGAPTAHIKDYRPLNIGIHNIEVGPDPSRNYPFGVSSYGKASAVEDFAESYAAYLIGPVARGELPGVPGVSDLYFRDLFPARAKIFDDLFPDFAKTQLAEIKAARAAAKKSDGDRAEVRKAARERQAAVDKADQANTALSDIDELVSKRADVGIIEARLQEALTVKAISKVEADAIRKAVATGDATKVDAALARVAKKYGVAHQGRAGEMLAMDAAPGAMRSVSGASIKPGAQVRVVRRGATLTRNGETITLEPMTVREVTPDELAGLRQGVIDERTKVASAVAQLRAELDKGPVSGARVGQIADRNNLPVATRQALVKAAATPDGLKRAVAAQMKAAEVKASGVVNRGVAFDTDTMETRGAAAALDPGTKVKVVETGYVTEIDGKTVVLRRAVVEPIAPKVPAKSANALAQQEMDLARSVAGVAIDVEENAIKGASMRAINHRVSAALKKLRIERGPNGVYVWHRPGGDVRLVGRATGDPEIDAAQQMADMARDVARLTDAGASPDALVAAVRAHAGARGLVPVSRAGDVVPFDRDAQVTIGPRPEPGQPVLVVRPGYEVTFDGKRFVIEKPLVQSGDGLKLTTTTETALTDAVDGVTLDQRIDDIVSGIPAKAIKGSRAAVRAELVRQAELVPDAVRQFSGTRIATREQYANLRQSGDERGWAAYSLGGDHPGEILFHPRWGDVRERKILEGIIRRAYSDNHLAWSFPHYEFKNLDIMGGIFRHEFGHYISSKWPLTARGHAWGAGSRRQLLVPLAEELRVPPMPEGGDFVDWFHRDDVQRAIRSKVSDYAADGPDELLAEIWAVYSGRGADATPLAKRIGKIMADAWTPAADVGTATKAAKVAKKAAGKKTSLVDPDVAPRVAALPRLKSDPTPSQAAKAVNPHFGSTGSSGVTYRDAGKAGKTYTSDMGPLPHGAFEENCSNVVYAFEMRMRGFDIEASPLDVLDKYGYAAGRTYAEMDDLLTDGWRLPGGKPHKRTLSGQAWRSFKTVDAEIVRDWPEGGRGMIFVGRHIFNVIKRNGKAVYIEGQFDVNATRIVTAPYQKKYGSNYDPGSGREREEAKLVRLDDLIPTDGLLVSITRRDDG